MKRLLLILLCIDLLWISSYLTKRINHSHGGRYVSPPPELDLRWLQINYDEHYWWNVPLYYSHIPLVWMDRLVTNVDIRLWKNDFKGNKGNYDLEAYN